MKKLLSILLTLLLVLGTLPVLAEAETAPLSGMLYILSSNDTHGRAVAGNGIWGFQAVSQMKKDLVARGADVLLIDGGDFSQGSPIVNLDQGATAIDFLNASGYDVVVPGNHEFDWGTDNLYANAEGLDCPVLSANIVSKETGEPVFAPNAVFETSAHKVGIFGLTTPEAMTKSHPDKVKGILILEDEELYACAQAQIDELRAAGCDIVICVGHLGINDESLGNRSIDVINNVTGLDLYIDGHSHSECNEAVPTKGEDEKARLLQTGSYFANIGVVVIDAEGGIKTSLYSAPESMNGLTEIYAPADEAVADIVNSRNAEVNEQLGTPFATSEVLLNGERAPGVRTEETNLGDFCADALLWAAKKAYSDDVVACVTNGGGIRASIEIGDVTMLDMKTVFPYGNTVAVLTVTGAELLEALEAATWSTPDAIGAFPQVSGIVYTIDTSVEYAKGEEYPDSTYASPAAPGARVTIESVGGEAFSLEAEYTICTNDFVAAGGDTYYVFRYPYATTGYNTQVAMEDALVDYVQSELGGVIGEQYAEPAGRITVK